MDIFIFLHVTFVLVTFIVSFFILFRVKGDKLHRRFGWIFIISMLVSVITSFWIRAFGGLSFIHLLSLATIIWISVAIWAVKKKPAHWRYIHAINMGSAYIGIIIAGVGVFIRHVIAPGNVQLGGIGSLLIACIAIPMLILLTRKFKRLQ